QRLWTPLFFAAASGASADLIRLLASSGASVDETSSQGTTPLMAACRADNLPAVRILLRRGAGIGLRDQRLWTPLFFAAASGASADLIRLLASSGAAAGRGWFDGVRRPIRLRRPGHAGTRHRAGRRLTGRGRSDVEHRGRRAAGRGPSGAVGRGDRR
ncbi:MAG: ankyrin repeat domain-containing protein, partial [Actinomyces sp.]